MVALAAFVLAAFAGLAMAQQGGPPGGRRGGRWDPEQMRQRIQERFREMLGADDEEWTVIGPRLERVQTLQWQQRAGGMGFMFGRGGRGRFGPPGEDEAERELSPVQAAAEQLNETLENEDATADQIKERLTAYRQAREEARQELAEAQEELREVLTVRQEAQLVLVGLLD
jgi:hypothetical protein